MALDGLSDPCIGQAEENNGPHPFHEATDELEDP